MVGKLVSAIVKWFVGAPVERWHIRRFDGTMATTKKKPIRMLRRKMWSVLILVAVPSDSQVMRDPGVRIVGSVNISTHPAAALYIRTTSTIPVSGTFWQATQPVSGPLTDSELRAAAVPVSGTFWQTTQPTSLAGGTGTVAGLNGDALATETTLSAINSKTIDTSNVTISAWPTTAGAAGAMRCVKSDGSGFEACGGSSSGGTVNGTLVTATAGTGTFTVGGNVTVDSLPSVVLSQTGTDNNVDANVTNTVTVTATDLDNRDLLFASDRVNVGGSTVVVQNIQSTVVVQGLAFTGTSANANVTNTVTVKGAGAVVGESVSVRCVNAAGSAFESCAGGASSGETYTHIISSGSKADPWYINADGSTVSLRASGTNLTATGTSLNVNCTGGCGAAAQAGTFIAFSSIALTGSRWVGILCNEAGSGVILKVMSIHMFGVYEAAVTGLNTYYKLYRLATASTCTNVTGNVVMADTTDSALGANVKVYNTCSSVTGQSGSLGGISLSSEETALQANEKYIYRYWGNGEKPITLRAGQCVGVQQGALTAAAGSIGARFVFTQE